jgi:hypothetical protein
MRFPCNTEQNRQRENGRCTNGATAAAASEEEAPPQSESKAKTQHNSKTADAATE